MSPPAGRRWKAGQAGANWVGEALCAETEACSHNVASRIGGFPAPLMLGILSENFQYTKVPFNMITQIFLS